LNEFEKEVLATSRKYNMFVPGDKVVVGLSGGADSCALLQALFNISKVLDLTLVAAHLNHGIRGEEALRDMDFSKGFSESLGITFISEIADVPLYAKENKISEEMAGRTLRYEFFRRICSQYHCTKIAVAHNKNDRAETIIMNLIRGCGANGLGGIKPTNGNIVRPLINIGRNEIEEYARENNINYVNDSTNSDNIYTRNIIRNNILKSMSEINPNVVENIIRTSDIVLDEDNFLSEICKEMYVFDCEKKQVTIERNRFLSLSVVQKRKIVLNALEALCNSTENISFSHIENIININNTGKTYLLPNGALVIYTSDSIIITSEEIEIPTYEYGFSANSICYVPETGISYRAEYVSEYKKEKNSVYIDANGISIDELIVRTRKDGDFFTPSGFKGTKKVKKFYIDSKIPRHIRNTYPLLEFKGEILAILPLRVSEKFKVTNKTNRILKISLLGGTYDKR